MSTTGRILLVEDDGRVVLPSDLRDKLELHRGELVAIETPDGVLLTSRRAAIERDLARVDAELREHGLTLDEVVESGREIRGEITRERYGLDG
jgi:AbrB family looped-hinge helix DNA binding protein